MNLNQSIRSAFVRAALDDVPQVDYTEQARTLVTKAAIAQLPDAVRAMYLDPKTSQFIRMHTCYIGTKSSCYALSYATPTDAPLLNDVKVQAVALLELANDQQVQLRALHVELTSVASSARTRKQLAEMLPEFDKYLPADQATANRNVPCLANVLTNFVKAGWPKKVPVIKKVKAAVAIAA